MESVLPIQNYKREQLVRMFRQIEVMLGNVKTTLQAYQAYKEVGFRPRPTIGGEGIWRDKDGAGQAHEGSGEGE